MSEKRRGNPNFGGKPKFLSKDEILRAMAMTKSNNAAARFCKVSFPTYRKYAKQYKNAEGISLFEAHKNQSGKGIAKFLFSTNHNRRDNPDVHYKRKQPGIRAIIEGKVDHHSYPAKKIREALINEGILLEQCCNCGFSEKRVLDYKVPLLFHFKDGNKQNYLLENLELLCYNCYFLSVGDIFDDRQIVAIEDYVAPNNNQKLEPDWEVPEHLQKRMKDLGLEDDDEDLDILGYV